VVIIIIFYQYYCFSDINQQGIYIINADGLNEQKINTLYNGTQIENILQCSISPNGEIIAFSTNWSYLYVVDIDNSDLRYIAQGLNYSWSPDYNFLLYFKMSLDQGKTVIENGIYLYDVSQNIETCMLKNNDPEKIYFYSMVWSLDGEQIYYILNSYWNNIDSSSYTSVNQLYLINIHTTFSILASEQNIFLSENCIYLPGVSPDGKLLIYNKRDTAGAAGSFLICSMNTDGTGQKEITTGLDYEISPDSSKIAFLDKYNNEYDGLYVIDIDGSNRRLLAYSEECDIRSINWTPDSFKILFIRY